MRVVFKCRPKLQSFSGQFPDKTWQRLQGNSTSDDILALTQVVPGLVLSDTHTHTHTRACLGTLRQSQDGIQHFYNMLSLKCRDGSHRAPLCNGEVETMTVQEAMSRCHTLRAPEFLTFLHFAIFCSFRTFRVFRFSRFSNFSSFVESFDFAPSSALLQLFGAFAAFSVCLCFSCFSALRDCSLLLGILGFWTFLVFFCTLLSFQVIGLG